MVSSNYKLFKSNITISFLPDELIIACSLAHIDHSICRILISDDFLMKENHTITEGGRWYKMIHSNTGRHQNPVITVTKKTLTYIRIYSTIHSVVITYWRTFAKEKITIIIFCLHFFGMKIQLNQSIFIRLKSILL